MCCFILSACQRDLAFSESRRQKGPPRTTIDGLCTMRSRDGYNVSLRFCDRRSIFHFSINPAAHNTINDIQKLFSDRVCNFTFPLHLQYPPRHPPLVVAVPACTFIYYAYIVQTKLVMYICI